MNSIHISDNTTETTCAVTGLPCCSCTPCCGSRRDAAPENEPLTCDGCVYEPYAPSEVHCIGCARMYGDRYARKPEVTDT